ncbi:MAG: hypothetical protein ACIAQF_08230 [Phycisphaerales bacterium JB065]
MTRIGIAAGLLLAAGSTAIAGQTTNFARSTFDLSEWTREAHLKPLNGTQNGAVFIFEGNHQQTGSCLELRWFAAESTILFGMAFLDEATWDPATDGAINSVNLAMSAMRLDPNISTLQSGRFYLEQGGHYYEYSFGIGTQDPVAHFSTQDVTEEDFAEVFFENDLPRDPNSNPDFSESGAPIRFGFGQTYAFFDDVLNLNVKTGIDNYSLQIDHEPAPGPVCPGDFNDDGQINLADLNILLANFGTDVTVWTDGDATGDGSVDLADLNLVLANFGTNCF